MTESARHLHSVARLRTLLQELGAEIKVNDWERGDAGFRYPILCTERGQIQYTADIFCMLPNGTYLDVEVDYKYKRSPIAEDKKKRRDADLWRFGIVTVRAHPSDVDLWVKHPGMMEEEINYRLKQADKLMIFARQQA